jgi:uncharacterized protein (DUF952 family)
MLEDTIRLWILRISNERNLPRQCQAIYIGMFQSETVYKLHFLGSLKFDIKDSDWACTNEEDYIPKHQYLKTNIPTTTHWKDFESQVVNIIKDLYSASNTILSQGNNLAAGFDSGDLIYINTEKEMPFIYHIIPSLDWEKAQEKGEYRPPSLEAEGFIHNSTEEQVVPVANAFYARQKGLLLLVIDPAKLTSPLRWDPPAHPAPESAPASLQGNFPHIYGTLNLDAIVEVLDFAPNENGHFSFSPA